MGLLSDRRGNLSWFRISILALIVGLGFVAFGFVSFQVDQQSRRSPFVPALPSGATQWGLVEPLGAGYQRTYYRVSGSDIDGIATFYQQEMAKFYGSTAGSLEQCQRQPAEGEFTNIPDQQRPAGDNGVYDPDFVPGSDIPVLYKCMFDRSGFNSVQDTLVWIQPGTRNEDPNLSTLGEVVVIYEQRWQN